MGRKERPALDEAAVLAGQLRQCPDRIELLATVPASHFRCALIHQEVAVGAAAVGADDRQFIGRGVLRLDRQPHHIFVTHAATPMASWCSAQSPTKSAAALPLSFFRCSCSAAAGKR
ncbi:hypothetical protein G6F68_018215 [Rhizopus microsporus]|nr:hypothetical protein G6F68_018215 [Rhizopus microsporus]